MTKHQRSHMKSNPNSHQNIILSPVLVQRLRMMRTGMGIGLWVKAQRNLMIKYQPSHMKNNPNSHQNIILSPALVQRMRMMRTETGIGLCAKTQRTRLPVAPRVMTMMTKATMTSSKSSLI